MSDAPQVSVVIPVYNSPDLLPDAVDSVLDQTYRDYEAIIVDDGSTDETPEVAENYADGDRIRCIHKRNGGSASARNQGIRSAKGEYIALLDADDEWAPEKLMCQMKQFDTNSSLAWSYTDWYRVDLNSGTRLKQGSQVAEYTSGDVVRPLLARYFIPPSTEVIHSSVFEEIGYYDESSLHRTGEDWEFSLRMAERYPAGYVDRPLVNWRCHENSKTSTMDLESALESHCAIIKKVVKRNPEKTSDLRDEALADRYTNFGRKWLNRESRRRALEHFFLAIQHEPTYWRAWLYAVSVLLPRRVLRVLGRLRIAFWDITRSLPHLDP